MTPASIPSAYSCAILANAPAPTTKDRRQRQAAYQRRYPIHHTVFLRVDLEVEGARGDNVAGTIDRRRQSSPLPAAPELSVIIRNPSDTAFEYEVKSRLRSNRGISLKPVRMTMPVRASMETEDRYLGRVLPKSAVRMEEIVRNPS